MSRAGRYGPAHYARLRAEREKFPAPTDAQVSLLERAADGVHVVAVPRMSSRTMLFVLMASALSGAGGR